MKGRLYSFLAVVTILFFAFLAGFALLHPGLPPTHDGEYHIVRFYEFDKTLRGGDWYPRWALDLNNGYGVPLFNYVYPLPNYVASLLHLFGISFIDAFKLQMFFATILGGIFFYLWIKGFWGNLGGIVSSVFYIFSPYRFVDIYIRGSVGEVWAFAFFPAFLWAIARYMQNKQKIFFILSSIFLSLIIFSHNILALMFFVFSIFYIGFFIYQDKNKKYLILNAFYIILLGLGISAIFWLPALAERSFVTGLQIYAVEDNFPQLYQLIFPSWGSGFSASDSQNQMSFQIGVANLLAVVIAALALALRKKHEQRKGILLFFLVAFASVFFLMLKISLPLWRSAPLMDYFQFPWRFLSLEILIASFLAGSVVGLWPSKILAYLMLLLAVWLGIEYTKPAYYHDRDDEYYITRSNFIDGTNSPGNYFNTIWMNRNLKREKQKVRFIEGTVKSEILTATNYKFILDAKKDTIVILNIAYFPGWKVFADEKELKTSYNKDGLISFTLSKGNHEIKMRFGNTLVRIVAEVITLLSAGVLFLVAIRIKKDSEVQI